MSASAGVVTDDGVSGSVGGGVGPISEDVQFGGVASRGGEGERLIVDELYAFFP